MQVPGLQSIASVREMQEALTFAMGQARAGMMGFEQALQAAIPIIRQRAEAECDLVLRETREQTYIARAVGAATVAGGGVPGVTPKRPDRPTPTCPHWPISTARQEHGRRGKPRVSATGAQTA